MGLICFYKVKFCCKNAHAKMLHSSGYPAVAELLFLGVLFLFWYEKVEEDLKCVEVV